MRFFIIFFLLACKSLFAMDLGKSELEIGSSEMEKVQKQILNCLKDKKSNEIVDYLNIFKEKAQSSVQEFSMHTKKIPTNTPTTLSLGSFFEEAEKQAQANVEGAARQLTWLGNTGRRNQAFAGLVGILFGLAKGGYELYLYGEDETDYVKNSFDIAGNLASIGFGFYLIKQAWQNAGANGEFGKAKAVLQLIQDQKNWVTQFALQADRIEQKIDLLNQESMSSSMESTVDSLE
jgi:hypothetical protein